MNLKVGDIVTIKPLEEIEEIAKIAKIAKSYDNRDGTYVFEGYYNFIKEMFKYCGKQVEIKEIEHELCYYRLKEDNGVFIWIEDWFVKEEPYYVTDFDGTGEEITPAEAYWEQVMPQIKEIVINAYNKGAEIGKAE